MPIRTAVTGTVALAAAAILAGCSSSSPSGGGTGRSTSSTASSPTTSPSTSAYSLSLSLTLLGDISTTDATPAEGLPCFGISNQSQNFEDITEGATVKVLDGAGTTIAVGQLGAGTLDVVEVAKRECRFPIQIDDIPAGKGVYSLEIGSHDGEQMSESSFKTQSDLALKSITYSG